MEFLIKNATIIGSSSRGSKSKKDILVKNGIIVKIANKVTSPSAKIIESANLHVSPGWIDLGTQIAEPGFEHRDTLKTTSDAAAAGGFTAVACFPNTNPVIDNKSAIQFILNQSTGMPVTFLPIAAMSQGINGQDITEMMDLHHHGAVAFSDGNTPVQNSALLLRALLYVKAFGGTIIQKPIDEQLANHGQINEGQTSIELGMVGIPDIAETAAIQQELEIAKYTESRLVFHTISTEEGYRIIKAGKKKSNHLFSTVAYKNLLFVDADVDAFNVNLKLHPPLRGTKDMNALVKGINDNTIDAICSNHIPLEEELKKLEFSYADFGAIGLETCFAALNTSLGDKVDLNQLCKKLSSGPRKILQLPDAKIKEGAAADITLFDPNIEWTYEKTNIKSKSYNSPFIGRKFKGKVLGIINGKKQSFN